MRTIRDTNLNVNVCKPDTLMEILDSLEDFLVSDIEAGDYSKDYIEGHIKISRNELKEILQKLLMDKLRKLSFITSTHNHEKRRVVPLNRVEEEIDNMLKSEY